MDPTVGFQEKITADHPELQVRTLIRSGRFDTALANSHWHEEMEIIYDRHGSGIQQVGSSFFPVEPGEITVMCPNQIHSFLPLSSREEFDILVLQFSLPQVLEHMGSEKQFCSDWLSGRIMFDYAIDASGGMGSLMELIHRELNSRGCGYSCAIRGALQLLLTMLYRSRPAMLPAGAEDVAGSQRRILMNPAISFLMEHYQQENLSVEQAAREANLSVTHFCRLFKQTTGMGFHEYLNRYRIIQAEHLFSTPMSLSEIAYACGFGSDSAFLRNYKKYRGMSPRCSRREHG